MCMWTVSFVCLDRGRQLSVARLPFISPHSDHETSGAFQGGSDIECFHYDTAKPSLWMREDRRIYNASNSFEHH